MMNQLKRQNMLLMLSEINVNQVKNVTDVCLFFIIFTQNYFANSNNTSITVPVLNEEP